MKNITVSVDDEVYRRSRVRAAEIGTSVSALVREFLDRLGALEGTETDFDRLKREQDRLIAEIRARHPRFSASDRLPREQLHERDAVR